MAVKHVFEVHGVHNLSHPWRTSLHPSGKVLLYLQALTGFLLFCVMSDGFAYLLKKASISLPGSVAGLIILVVILFISPTNLIMEFLKVRLLGLVSVSVFPYLTKIQPASSMLLKWLSIFYVPAVVTLPLSLRLVHPQDYPKLLAIQIGGVLFIGIFSGWCLIGLMHLRGALHGFRTVGPGHAFPAPYPY